MEMGAARGSCQAALGLTVLVGLSAASAAVAQPAGAEPASPQSAAAEPAGAPPARPPSQPPPAPPPAGAPPLPAQGHERAPKRWEYPPVEAFALLGFGNAVCDNEQPDSDCPVDGAVTLGLGAGYRVSPSFSVGGELGLWSYNVNDAWRGQLEDDAIDVQFSSVYLAGYARWYFAHAQPHGYLQAGLGFGAVTGTATNDSDEFQVTNSGVVIPLGIGMEWQLGDVFRLGPQALAYLQLSGQHCETLNGDEECSDAGKDDNALPWRVVLVGTFTFGKR